MAITKTVKVFTGFVEQDQLAKDMRILKGTLGGLRSIFMGRGIRLRTEQCDSENIEDIKEAISGSDVCIFLFMTELSPQARSQFDCAYERMKSDDTESRPSILVWFREAEDAEMSEELSAFRGELRNDIGHFINRYTDIDTVQFQLLLHLEREGAGVPFVWVGTKLLDSRGNVVMDFANTAAYSGNEMLQSVRKRLSEYEARQQELLERELDDDLSDDEADELDELSDKIAQAMEEEAGLQERFLSDMRQFVVELSDDRQMSPRRRKAIQLISTGRVREGYELLDTREIERDTRAHEERAKVAAAEAQSERGWVLDGVKQLLLNVKMLLTFVEEQGAVKDEEIRHSYAVAIEFEERNGFEPLASVGYGEYLVGIGVFDKAVDLLDGACAWYRRAIERTRDAQFGMYVAPDPFMPDLEGLRRGLAHALGLLVKGEVGADASSSAAYAASERIDILRELFELDDIAYGAESFSADLISAGKVMAGAGRPDDALEYYEQAIEELEELIDAEGQSDCFVTLADAVEARRDLLVKMGHAGDARAATLRLIEVLRQMYHLFGSSSSGSRLAKELRDRAHDAIGANEADSARELSREALEINRRQYETDPSSMTAIALSKGYRNSSILAARMRDSEQWATYNALRLHVLVVEYRRVPTTNLQKEMGSVSDELMERWRSRQLRDAAEKMLPEFLATADALEGIAAPGEEIFFVGMVVGNAIMGAVEMLSVISGRSSEGERELMARLERLRADASDNRGLGLYSTAFECIAKHLQTQGRIPYAYGLVSERLSALRLACGMETMGERGYAHTAEDAERLRILIRALGYAAQYAREHGRPAEGNALIEERLMLLRESFEVVGGLNEVYGLNKALIELSEHRLVREDLDGMSLVLEEAWDNACELHEKQASDATLRNLLYVGKRVDHRYREAGNIERAEAVLRSCLDQLVDYCNEHDEPEVLAYAAHVIWMYVVEIREAETGSNAIEQEVLATYEQMTGRLVSSDDSKYLSYLSRHLNYMVDNGADDEERRETVDLSMAVAERAYQERVAAGTVQPDDLRTLSSIYELGILVAFGRGFHDQAEELVSRCVGLYESRYERALSQDGSERAALSVEECASQLSKQLTRLAKDMRKYGLPERADELGTRSTQLLAEQHKANPRSRVSFVYSAQLHNDSLRLISEGRLDEGIDLRRKSTEVLDRYRLADPTERNLLWYARSLMDLARVCRDNGRPDEADTVEERTLEVLAESYESSRSLMLLTRYLYTMSNIAFRLQKRDGGDSRALDLYRDCERLASEAFHRSPSVESARLLGLMQVYLFKQLSKMGLRDEAQDLTSREVETQRYLFEHGRTQRAAKVFATALYNAERRLRWLSRNLGRKDYSRQALELHDERIEVMRWLSYRDVESAQRLVAELTKEITIIDPRDPWILKSMRRVHDVGHNYPPRIGAERALVCQEALLSLYREAPSVELEDQLCDMKGVRVQFLSPNWRVGKGGELETDEMREDRLCQAANELYELVPLLEDRYAREPGEANAYRMAYYLKLAGVVFEAIGRTEDALDALDKRTELLKGEYAHAEGVTALTKYTHALSDQSQLLTRMGRYRECLQIDREREKVCRSALACRWLTSGDRKDVESDLMSCLKHRESTLYQLGGDMLVERTENLEAYIELLRKRYEACKLDADAAGEGIGTPATDQADDGALASDDALAEGEDDKTSGAQDAGNRLSTYAVSLAINLGRLATCKKGLGETAAATSAYGEAIRLLREVGESCSSENTLDKARNELRRLLVERAIVLAEHFGIDASPDRAGSISRREMVVKAALDEALAVDVDVTELPTDEVLVLARLHQLRYQFLRNKGELEAALADAEAVVASLDAIGEESVDPIERASAIAEWGKTLGECGRTEEAEVAREMKTEGLRRAYSRQPSAALGLYLAFDLSQRASAAESSGQRERAIEMTLERLGLLCSLELVDADQRKSWRIQLKNAIRKLTAHGQTNEWRAVADDALVRAERSLAQRASGSDRDSLAAAAHLDILVFGIRNEEASEDSVQRIERLARYGRQVLTYAKANALEPGLLDYHARHAAELFGSEGLVQDESYMLFMLRRTLETQWRREQNAAVGTTLYQLYADLLDEGHDAAAELEVLRAEVRLAQELSCRGLSTIGDKRIYRLYERTLECAEEAGAPFDVVTSGLALVDRDYELAEQADAMLEPLAEGIAQRLSEIVSILREQRCVREASRLDYEARNCGKTLGKPGWNWWRKGYKSIGYPWRQESELGAAQKRLQRVSHVMRRSLELGDWSHKRENYRNLRNLIQLRYEAYRRGQDAREQVKLLARLRWCLLNASTMLYQHRNEADGLLAESIVLRIEMLEVLADIALLKASGPQASQASQEYVKELRAVAALLRGDEYEGLGYADVRTWALELADETEGASARKDSRRRQ